MSWDRPWEPTPERTAQEREWGRRRLERLGETVTATIQELVDLSARADAEAAKLQELDRLLDRKRELLTEIALMQQDRTEAEKATRATERQLEFERRRFERLGQRRNGPRVSRPVRVDVDGVAWAVLQREVVAQGTYLIWRMELVRLRWVSSPLTGCPVDPRRGGVGVLARANRHRVVASSASRATMRRGRPSGSPLSRAA